MGELLALGSVMAIGYRYHGLYKAHCPSKEIAGVSRLIFGETTKKDLVFLCFGNFNHQALFASCF